MLTRLLLLIPVLFLPTLAPGPAPVPKDTLPAWDPEALPRGLVAKPTEPKDNPLTPAKVALGRRLFFDPRLSADGTVACATCHRPEHGFASPEPRAVGIRGQLGRRNAPSLLNRGYGTVQFWDGRAGSLEEQALKPIEDPLEMAHTVDAVLDVLKKDAAYQKEFAAVFKDGVNRQNLAHALAAFQRTLLHADTVYDAFIDSDVAHLSTEARQGLWLFESKGGCWRCHIGPNFTDEKYHNTGVSWGSEPKDLGRFEVTKRVGDEGKFKTPTLRAAALTPPYMHDGSIATLEEVVKFYNRGGKANPYLDPAMRPLVLDAEEEKALVAFLKALSEKVK